MRQAGAGEAEQRLTTGGDCSLLRAGRTKREVVSANPAGAGTWQEVQPFLEMQVEAASVPLLPLSPLPMPPVGKYNHRSGDNYSGRYNFRAQHPATPSRGRGHWRVGLRAKWHRTGQRSSHKSASLWDLLATDRSLKPSPCIGELRGCWD